jgi:hypothetical protein
LARRRGGKSAIAETSIEFLVVLTGIGVGATGTIHFSPDIENAIYKVTEK